MCLLLCLFPSQVNTGVDIETGAPKDLSADGIMDLYATKWWAVKLATDAVITVLKVDQIIMAKQVSALVGPVHDCVVCWAARGSASRACRREASQEEGACQSLEELSLSVWVLFRHSCGNCWQLSRLCVAVLTVGWRPQAPRC